MRQSKRAIAVVLWLGLLLVAAPLNAQEAADILPEELAETIVVEPGVEGSPWNYRLVVGANLNFASTSHVVGTTDGQTWTVGANLDAGAYYVKKNHDWRNTLLVTEAFTRTPVLEEFVKSADALALESLYLFHLTNAHWFGPFARFTLDTALLPGRDVRGEENTYKITYLDGETATHVGDRMELTTAFQPLVLSESVGVFFEPVAEETVTYEFLAGFGAQEIFAGGQLALMDNEDTPEIEVGEIESHNLAGLAASTSVYGSFEESKVSYDAGGEVLIPFINDLRANDDRSAIDIAEISFYASLSFKLVDWASLDYRFDALRQPLVVDEWQLTHLLLLSFNYTFIDETPTAE